MKAKSPSVLSPEFQSTKVRIHPAMRPFTGYCLYKVALRIRGLMDEKLESFHLLAPQCGLLTLLDKVGPLTQVELGGFMSIDKATMVRFVDGLEKKKYLIRRSHTKDRRSKILQITKAGKQLLESIQTIRKEVEDEVFAPLSADERRSLRDLIAKIVIHDAEIE